MANKNLDILKYIEEQRKKQEEINKQTSSSQIKTATSSNKQQKKVDNIGSTADYLLKSGYVGLANNIDSLGGGIFKSAGNLGQTTNDILDKIASDNMYEAYRDRTKEDFDYDITDEQLTFLNDAYRKHREQYLKDYDYNNPTNIAETILGQDRVNKIIDKVDNNKVADFLDQAGDYYFDRAKNRNTGYEDPDNFLLKTAGDVSSGIGGMIPSIATSLATGNPSAGLAVMGTGAYGSAMNEALQDGSNLGDAALYGLASAATEIATEKLTGGLDYFGKGTLDDVTEKLIDKAVKDEGKKKVANFLVGMAGEGLEEYVSDVVGEYTQDIYKPYEGDKNVIERFVDTQPSALYSGLVGGLTAGVLNGVPIAIDKAINRNSTNDTNVKSEPTKVINEEFLNENKTPIQENIINNESNNVNNLNNITPDQTQNISQNITNNLDLNQNDLMNTDINDDNASDVLDMLLEQSNQNTVADNAKLNDASVNEQSNINTQENENIAENALNDAKNIKTIDEQLVKNLKSKDNAIKMESQRINEETILREGRSINYDENQLTKLAKMSNDIGVPIRVVESLDKGAEGKYDNGIIYISKNCQNPIQAVLKHELLHHISKTTNYKKLESTLIKLAEKKYGITEQDGINNRIQEYANRGIDLTYEEAREEYTAVIAQDLFSDIDSIEKFVQLDLNLAQKVYNWIKEKIYQVTGNEEKEYLMKAERLYRKAFEESKYNNSTNNTNSRNSISSSITSTISSIGNSFGSDIDTIKNRLDYQINKDAAPIMESQRIINNILSEDISVDDKVRLLNDYSNEFDSRFAKNKFNRNIEALENGYNSAKEYSKFKEYLNSINDFSEAEAALNELKLDDSLNDKQYAYELKKLTDKYNELKKYDINSFDRKLVPNKELTNDQKIITNNLDSIEYRYAGDDRINIYAVDKNGNLYDSSVYSIDGLAKKYGSTIANEIISNVDNTRKKITKFNNYDVYTNEMIDKIVKDAEKNFGLTNNPDEAGYLTINGKMLDFSEKKNGGQAGMRSLDHIAVENMSDFMDMGNIRLQPEAGGFELLKEPNDIQYKKLRSYLKNNTVANNNGVFIGFSKDKYSIGRNGDGFLSYDAPINVDQIINDVKAHYNQSENTNYSLGTNLNRMNENAELKDRVAGWYGLEKRTVKKIVDLEQDTYKGTDLNNLVQEAAKEALRTGKVSDTTRNHILNELENNNYFAEDLYDGEYQRLMDFIGDDHDIVIENRYKQDIKELLASNGAKGNYYNGLKIKFSDYDNAKSPFLDSIYDELRNQFPSLENKYHPADQLEEILHLIDEIKPNYKKTAVENDIKEYMKSELNDILDVFETEVVYRSDKSAFDAFARKVNKENGIFNASENIKKLLSKDAQDEIENIDLNVDDNKYKEVSHYVEFMRNYSNYNMSITNNNDIVANKNKVLRQFLYENTEEKVFKAGEEFADNKRKVTDRLYAAMKKYDIKPGSKESAAVQKLGEGQQQVWYDASMITGKKGDKTRAIEKYTLEDLAKEFPEKADQERIIAMEKECRKIYDEYVDRHNAMLEKIYPEEELTYEKTKQKDAIMLEINTLKNNLELFKQAERSPAMMAQINQTIKDIKNAEKRLNNVDADVKKNKRLEKRSNYYHHFKEMTRAESIKSIFTDNNQINIDNNLAGVSEFTRPKAKWQDYMQERTGDAEYTEDAINGLLKYIDQAEYSIAFDPVINDLREFNKAIVKYSNDAEINNSKYIEFLTDYTNDIAGKTNPYDRWLSKGTNGRKILRAVKLLNNTAKANAVMGNLNSAISQFYNLPNSISLLMKNGGNKSSLDLSKGSKDYTNYVRNKLTGKDITNEPITHSAFLKQRYMEDIDAKFDTSKFKVLKDAASKVMQLGDQAVAELTWYSAYEQGLRKKVTNPITYADDITRRAIAGRGVGEVPLMQKSQIVKLLAPFQVEVTNQWNLMKQLVGEKNVGPLIGMFLTTSIMNLVNKAMTGRTVGFDPVDVVMDVIKNAGDDDDKDDILFDALGRVSGELISNMPMGTNIATFALNDSQRTKLFGESDPTRFGTSNIGVQNFVKPVVDFATGNNVDYMNFIGNFVTPYGGKQLERAYKYAEDAGIIPRIDINRKNGITISNKAGAYNDKGQLKYAIDDDPLNIAKGLAFGTYATDQGKEYIDNNYSPLSEKRTAAYESLIDEGVDSTTAYEAIRNSTAIDSIKDNYGETIKNSRAAEVRKYLEDADLYDDVINAGVYEEFNLNKTIIGMTQSEFDEFYNSLQK